MVTRSPLARRMRSAAGGNAIRKRVTRSNSQAIGGGPNLPKPPMGGTGANEGGYSPISYGQQGEKTGIAQAGQARNQPGFVPRGQRPGGTPGYPGGGAPAPAGTPAGGAGPGLGPLVWDTSQQNYVRAGTLDPATFSMLDAYGNYATQDQAIVAEWNKNPNWGAFTGATGITPQFREAGTSSPYNASDPTVIAARSTWGMGPERAAQTEAGWAAADARRQPVPAGYSFSRGPQGDVAPYSGPHQGGPQGGPQGGQAPTTPQGGTQTPQGPSATPDAAMAAGRDPTKHVAYWESKGWSHNPATGAWTDRNGSRPNQQGSSQTPPINSGQIVPTPQGQQAGTQPSSQLPLDPQFEAQRRYLDANLQRQLAQVNAGQGRLTAEQQLATARMDTNQGVDQQQLLENMAARNTMNSSIYGDQTGLLATDYGRQHADLAASIADAMAGLSGQAGDAQTSYEQGLIEAMSASAQSSANDPDAPTPRPTRKKPRKRPRKRKRGR